jgi:carboxyl-terminal processing protease
MKQNIRKINIIILISITYLVLTGFKNNDSTLYKIDKSFNLYGSLFKSIVNNYVIDIDPEFLMKEGIKGIVSSLDPYTSFYDNEDDPEYEVLVEGSYVGFGITVGPIDSLLTITEVLDGFPAKKAGLRIGDVIYKIDDSIVININSNDLRRYTSGKPGSRSSVWVLREGFKDTLKFNLIREDIKLASVSYYGMLKDSYAFIKLESFSKTSAEEFRSAFLELKRKHDLQGLVIDLRNNPGGYLEAAVNICELFVPKGTKIVSTKGPTNTFDYFSDNEPIDTQIPIAVLINGSSASASEIVAGALQDLDRAVIIGERSFGKGLVQTIIDLPYKKSVKITTAKYYIPSGRCIQRIEYDIDGKMKIKNSPRKDSTFFTKNYREVKEQNGITPDVIVKDKNYPDYVVNLLANNVIFGFINKYTANTDKISFQDKLDDSTFQKFLDYYTTFLKNPDKQIFYKNPIQKSIADLNKLVVDTALSENIKYKLADTRNLLIQEEVYQVNKNRDLVKDKIQDEIIYRFNSYKDFIKHKNEEEEIITNAIDYLNPSKYKKVLTYGR